MKFEVFKKIVENNEEFEFGEYGEISVFREGRTIVVKNNVTGVKKYEGDSIRDAYNIVAYLLRHYFRILEKFEEKTNEVMWDEVKGICWEVEWKTI